MLGQELISQEQLQQENYGVSVSMHLCTNLTLLLLRVGEDASAIHKTTFSMPVRAGIVILLSHIGRS